MKILGRHLLIELYKCNPSYLNDVEKVREKMLNAARYCKSTILGDNFHTFEPQGVSGVVIIAESHLSIHTWPEYGYAAVDIYTCGEQVNPWDAYNYLLESFECKKTEVREIKRGKLCKGKVI